MSVEVVDGIKVMRLKDDILDGGAMQKAHDMLADAHLYHLIAGGNDTRDGAVFARRVL